jgi:hypothetical protein
MILSYDYFLLFVIILKITFFISEFFLLRYKRLKINHQNKDNKLLTKWSIINEDLLIMTEFCMFLLLCIIFRPGDRTIVINRNEKLIFFALGILGLTNLKYKLLVNPFL